MTLSAGLAHNVGPTCCGESAPSLAASYAYRILSHLDLEAGVDATTLLGTEIRGANYDIKANDRFTWVPFGLKGVLPLGHGRAEAFAGGGGLYERYSVGSPFLGAGLVSRDGWGPTYPAE